MTDSEHLTRGRPARRRDGPAWNRLPFLRTRLQATLLPVALVAGAVGGTVVLVREGPVAVAIFVALMVGWIVQRAVPDLIEERHPGRRSVYFVLRPLAATAVLLAARAGGANWWWAVALGLFVGAVLHLALAWLLVRDVTVEELVDELERSGVEDLMRGRSSGLDR